MNRKEKLELKALSLVFVIATIAGYFVGIWLFIAVLLAWAFFMFWGKYGS